MRRLLSCVDEQRSPNASTLLDRRGREKSAQLVGCAREIELFRCRLERGLGGRGNHWGIGR